MVTWLFAFAFHSALSPLQVRELSLLTGMRIRDVQNLRKDMPGSGRFAGNVGLQLEQGEEPGRWRLRAFTHDLDKADLPAVETLRQQLVAFLPTIASGVKQLSASPALPPVSSQHDSVHLALMKQERWREAVAELTYAHALSPTNPDIVLQRATSLRQLERLEDALVDYGLAIELAPQDASIYSARASVYTFMGRFAPALEDLCRAQSLAPDDPIPLVKRGRIYYDMAEYGPAVDAFSRAIALAPHEGDIYFFRACAHFSLQRYDEALDDLRCAEDLSPTLMDAALPDVLFNQVVALVRLERRGDAIAPLSRLIQLRESDEHLYLLRAVCSEYVKDYDPAVADCDKVLLLNPNDARAFNVKGVALGKLGRTKDAVAEFSSAILIDTNNAVYRQNRALAYAKLGRLGEAADEYRRAILLQPKNALLHSQLGAVRVAQGEFTEGLNSYLEALRLDPAHTATKDRVNTLLPLEADPALGTVLQRAILGEDEAIDQLVKAMHQGFTPPIGDMIGSSDFQQPDVLKDPPRPPPTLAKAA